MNPFAAGCRFRFGKRFLAKPAGFKQKFEAMLRAGGEFPIEVAEVRMAKDPLTTTANGCLIAAMSEAR